MKICKDSLIAGVLKDGCHYLTARIYYADTDFSGVVYHARFLEFLERGRTDFMRLHDIEHSRLLKPDDPESLIWVVSHLDLRFLRPAKMDDIICIETCLYKNKGARGLMRQRIRNQHGEILVKANVEVVLLNKNGKPVRWSETWLNLFVFSDIAD